jgi:translocation and assembly module TamB
VTYAGGPFRFDLTARSDRVRIRYPVGMSWLTGGTLRLTGDANAATLSGRVTVERLLMAEGLDLGSLVASSVEPVSGPSTTSAFLRNLQFDIQADLAPNARFEWTSARFQTEASMRVRGTWEHPILLGHLHLLNGEMEFRGNRYQLSRGDINFANPFRLDPAISIEAVTTIRQYEVTVNFTGPASHLTMSYRSDPPLPSSDIIALLALGQTGEETALRGAPTTQTTQTGATTLLSEAISSQLGGRIQRLFGISHFSVDPFLTNTTAGSETTARITISQQISHDLIITYVTNITSTQQQIIQIEYAVRRDVSIVALRDQNGTFGVDVVFKKRFK